jgi:hypothetical protein
VRQYIVTIYAAVKRTMKAFKWVVFLACIVLVYYVDEFGEYLVKDHFSNEKGIGIVIFFVFLAVLVCVFWGAYYLLERLAGYQGSFSQFFSENLPGPSWLVQSNKSKDAIQKNKKR